MLKSITVILTAIGLLAAVNTAFADMVILKSGEMFQTRKAWRQGGTVYFYRNGKVVGHPESDVERLIQDSAPDQIKPPPSDPTLPAPQSSAPLLPSGDNAGYLRLKWQQSPSRIQGLTPAGTDTAYGGVQLYTIDKQDKHFGRANVDNIFLGFWQGGLYTILVEVSNYLDFTDLKQEAFRRFGKGEQDEGNPERYRWSGPISDRLLSFDDGAGTGFLWMRSHALHQKVRGRYPD